MVKKISYAPPTKSSEWLRTGTQTIVQKTALGCIAAWYICDFEATTMTKKKVIYYYMQMGGLTVFFLSSAVHDSLFYSRPLSPTYLRRPRTCNCTPGTDYPKSRRSGLYMYIRFSFFFVSSSLPLLLGRNPSLSIPICLSLFYRLLWWLFLKYIYI